MHVLGYVFRSLCDFFMFLCKGVSVCVYVCDGMTSTENGGSLSLDLSTKVVFPTGSWNFELKLW